MLFLRGRRIIIPKFMIMKGVQCRHMAKGNNSVNLSKSVPPPHVLLSRFDYRRLRADTESMASNSENRGYPSADVYKTASLHEMLMQSVAHVNKLKAKRNKIVREISELVRSKERSEDMEHLCAAGTNLKNKLQIEELRQHELCSELWDVSQQLPNITHPDTPIGVEPHVLDEVGCFKGNPKNDHMLIAGGDIKLSVAAKTTGSGFAYFTGDVALLERALLEYAARKCIENGFEPVSVPSIFRSGVVAGCGFQPKGNSTQVFALADPPHGDLCLSGTAEIALAGLVMNETDTQESKLPYRTFASSHCYRVESGGLGKQSRGLYRLHEFAKVEMFAVTAANAVASGKVFDEFIDIQRSIVDGLELNYRVINVPACDLGAPAFRKIDMEAWMPSRNEWGEISSASDCLDYQSRRLNIRYVPKSRYRDNGIDEKRPIRPGELLCAHTVNATAIAIPRMILAILEQHVNDDGTVNVPTALRPFLYGRDLLCPRPAPVK